MDISIYLCIFISIEIYNYMVRIIRELCKVLMFVILWGFPLWLAKWNDDNNFLWFLLVSFFSTLGVFSHYEDLERIEQSNKQNDESGTE